MIYEKHVLQAGADNNMILCNYPDPGFGGEYMIWDFSLLESLHNFTGTLLTNARSKASRVLGLANKTLDEFNSRYYFKVTPERLEEIGNSVLDN